MSDEQAYWCRLIDELSEKFIKEVIAKEIGVSQRQVWNIRNGDKPKGLVAVRLYLFHMKHRTAVPSLGTEVHSIPELKV